MESKKTNNRMEYNLSISEARILLSPDQVRGASISETMGPNFKNIYWIEGRPYVLKDGLTINKKKLEELK